MIWILFIGTMAVLLWAATVHGNDIEAAGGEVARLISILPPTVSLEEVHYETRNHRLCLTDGGNGKMDLKENAWE